MARSELEEFFAQLSSELSYALSLAQLSPSLFHNKTLVSNMLTQPVGVFTVCIYVGQGADCGTPAGMGCHSQTKYHYIATSKIAKQRVFYNSYLNVLAVSFNLLLLSRSNRSVVSPLNSECIEGALLPKGSRGVEQSITSFTNKTFSLSQV